MSENRHERRKQAALGRKAARLVAKKIEREVRKRILDHKRRLFDTEIVAIVDRDGVPGS